MLTRVAIAFSLAALTGVCGELHAQGSAARYQDRTSDCRLEPPPGKSLTVRRSDSGVTRRGYTAERVLTFSADGRGLQGGDLVVCTEYGRVEIEDSDHDEVRLQVRIEGLGDGSHDPATAAARVIDETPVQAFLHQAGGRLVVRVWHPRLAFTSPGMQPAYVSVRLLVPDRGAYHVTTSAFHGNVAIRRLTLSGAKLRGNVGDKLKGIPGFVGQTELDHVTLAGDVDIDNLAGIPGVRPPVAAEVESLAASVLVKARVSRSCRLSVRTGSDIRIGIRPSPDLTVEGVSHSVTGTISSRFGSGVAQASPRDGATIVRADTTSPDTSPRPLRLSIDARSVHGSVQMVSVPAAPLAGAR